MAYKTKCIEINHHSQRSITEKYINIVCEWKRTILDVVYYQPSANNWSEILTTLTHSLCLLIIRSMSSLILRYLSSDSGLWPESSASISGLSQPFRPFFLRVWNKYKNIQILTNIFLERQKHVHRWKRQRYNKYINIYSVCVFILLM